MQKWWLLGAGVLGVFLAVLLIPQPETAYEVPDATRPAAAEGKPVARAPMPSGEDLSTELSGLRRPGTEGRVRKRRRGGAQGPNPAAAARMELRATPEYRYAARADAPWNQVKRLLAQKRTEPGQDETLDALVDRSQALVLDLRDLRRTPEAARAEELRAAQAELAADIRSSGYLDDEVERYLALTEERLTEYDSELENGEVENGVDAPDDGPSELELPQE